MAASCRWKRMLKMLHERDQCATAARIALLVRHSRAVTALLFLDRGLAARNGRSQPHGNHAERTGRMCEVSQPESRLSIFTVPYSRRGHSTGHPALRGGRLPPPWTTPWM